MAPVDGAKTGLDDTDDNDGYNDGEDVSDEDHCDDHGNVAAAAATANDDDDPLFFISGSFYNYDDHCSQLEVGAVEYSNYTSAEG